MSNQGMKYILVLFDYDSTPILARAMKSNKGQAITNAYKRIFNKLTEAGIISILQYLDNETFKELITATKKNNLKYQVAASQDHCLNPVERVVSTFKNHLIVILVGCDKRFPKYLWCQLISQAVITLNMLQQSRINPKTISSRPSFWYI